MAVAVAPGAGDGAAAVAVEEEQTEFDVLLRDFGANKINVIKAVREVTTLGLKEAKELVEAAPSTGQGGMPQEEARAGKGQRGGAGHRRGSGGGRPRRGRSPSSPWRRGARSALDRSPRAALQR